MDGPFFSLMPYPSRGLVHAESRAVHAALQLARPARRADRDGGRSATRARRRVHVTWCATPSDICRRCATSRYVDSLWEVKTLMPRSEQDDSRPILLQRSDELPGVPHGARRQDRQRVRRGRRAGAALAPRRAARTRRTVAPAVPHERVADLRRRAARGRHAADVVQAFVDETVAVLRGLVTHYEIILVDDGAAEETVDARARAARAATTSCASCACRATSAKRRRSPPVSTSAIGDYVIVMLPNMDPPSLIPEFFERARSRGGHRLRRAPASEERAVLVSRRRAAVLLVHQLRGQGRHPRRLDAVPVHEPPGGERDHADPRTGSVSAAAHVVHRLPQTGAAVRADQPQRCGRRCGRSAKRCTSRAR